MRKNCIVIPVFCIFIRCSRNASPTGIRRLSLTATNSKGDMTLKFTVKEVLQFVEENDVKFVRLVFFDVFGIKKNISIMSDELESVFEHGANIVPSNIDGFGGTDNSDLLLFPDPSTIKILPWRPQNGRVARLLCDIKNPNGTPFEGDVRSVLKNAVDQAEQMGFYTRVGVACEFYLFRLDDNGLPTRIPHDNAGYLDVAPLDKGENVRRQICLTLEEMGIDPLSSHHENGPGQNEIDFRHSDLLSAADDFVTFKDVVKTSAASNGLFASFMPKPLPDKSGSGMHINLMLSKYGYNIFKDSGSGLNEHAQSFIAGILAHAAEMTVFFNPLSNSYARFGSHKAPDTVDWSYQGFHSLIRMPEVTTDQARVDFRSPDPSCNPYLAFALLLYAGMDGINQKMKLAPPAEDTHSSSKLPLSLDEAVRCAENSQFIQNCLPPMIYRNYLSMKSAEVKAALSSVEQRQQTEERYFEVI